MSGQSAEPTGSTGPGGDVMQSEGSADQLRQIGHDEYDPIGTLVLIGIYFAILVFLWFFVYFVEFLGNGPTVVDVLAGVGL